MKKRLAIVAILVTGIGAFAEWWRRHPRFGAGTVNRIVNPWLVRQGVTDATRGEIGLLEHVGRVSGTVRVTPIHPVRTTDGLRIVVPLGGESQWARNVLAAGHCRVQVGETIHELDEPKLLEPLEVEGLPRVAAKVMAWLGFRYLRLHQFAEHPGTLEVAPESKVAAAAPVDEIEAPPQAEAAAEVEAQIVEPAPVAVG